MAKRATRATPKPGVAQPDPNEEVTCGYCGLRAPRHTMKPRDAGGKTLWCIREPGCIKREMERKQQPRATGAKDPDANPYGDWHDNYKNGTWAGMGEYTAKGGADAWAARTPAPFSYHPTGLPGVWAGRQMLTAADADRLVAETGVTHVLDLREEREWTKPNWGQAAIDRLGEHGVTRKHVPMRDMMAPTQADLKAATDFLAAAVIKEHGRVYVHCRAGKERTSAVLFCYAGRWRGGGVQDVIEAWTGLKEAYPTFKPLGSQVDACYVYLGVDGVLPCHQCDMPLEVGPNVGRATCTACVKWQAKEATRPKAYYDPKAGAGQGKLPLAGTALPAWSPPTGDGAYDSQNAVPDWKTELTQDWEEPADALVMAELGQEGLPEPFLDETTGEVFCGACGEHPAEDAYGLCGACEGDFLVQTGAA